MVLLFVGCVCVQSGTDIFISSSATGGDGSALNPYSLDAALLAANNTYYNSGSTNLTLNFYSGMLNPHVHLAEAQSLNCNTSQSRVIFFQQRTYPNRRN